MRNIQDIEYITLAENAFLESSSESSVYIVAVSFDNINDRSIASMINTLSISEHARFLGFRDRISALAFLIGRYIVRSFVSQNSSCSAHEVAIEIGKNGKPWNSLYGFNLSHAKRVVIAAFGKGVDIGIDIEWHRDEIDYLSIAQLVFPKEEYDYLAECSSDILSQYFLDKWTFHEARIKMDSLTIDDIRTHKSVPFKAWKLDFGSPSIQGHICCRRRDQCFADIEVFSL